MSKTNWNSYLGSVVHAITDPITMEIMLEPVMAADGFTYDKDSIKSWFDRKKAVCQPLTSPCTGAVLHTAEVKPNFTVKAIVESTVKTLESELAQGHLDGYARDLLVCYSARLIEKEANSRKLLRLPCPSAAATQERRGKLRRCYGFILPKQELSRVLQDDDSNTVERESGSDSLTLPNERLDSSLFSEIEVILPPASVTPVAPTLRRLPSLYTGVYHGVHTDSGSPSTGCRTRGASRA